MTANLNSGSPNYGHTLTLLPTKEGNWERLSDWRDRTYLLRLVAHEMKEGKRQVHLGPAALLQVQAGPPGQLWLEAMVERQVREERWSRQQDTSG